MPKFDLWSDLHIDTNEQPPARWEPQSDILVLPGDISDDMLQANQFLNVVSKSYKKIIYVRGNHEHYVGAYPIDVVENMGPSEDNIIFLTYNRPYHVHDNEDGSKTMFFGLTGWYDFNFPDIGMSVEAQKVHARDVAADLALVNFSYSDGSKIEPEELASRHASMLRTMVNVSNFCIDNKLKDACTEVVIVTHTVPHIKGVVPFTHPWAKGNGSFYNSLMNKVWEADKNKLISTWCFGHTHFPCDFTDNGIRFICNPRGRWSEQCQRGRLSVPIAIDSKEENVYK